MDNENEMVEKPRRKGRGGTDNFPTRIPTEVRENKELMSEVIRTNLKWYKMPRVTDDADLERRLDMFFTVCLEQGELPTVEKMCLAIGYSHAMVHAWEKKIEPTTTRRLELLKNARSLLSAIDAELVSRGKINPVVYIFRAKNYFGMRDQQEHILTPNNPLGDMVDATEIQKRLSDSIPIDE
jgi:hypothetical protein